MSNLKFEPMCVPCGPNDEFVISHLIRGLISDAVLVVNPTEKTMFAAWFKDHDASLRPIKGHTEDLIMGALRECGFDTSHIELEGVKS